jgi:type VI secretion system protein ImpI
MLAPRENNPLKFSANVEDALHKLLVQRADAYLDITAAFGEAFTDIRHHQLALLKSVSAAFDHMLARFDPEKLEARNESKGGGLPGVLNLGGKGKAWQNYVEYYAQLRADREHAYRRLFGEQWAKSYEQELAQRKSNARTPEGEQ